MENTDSMMFQSGPLKIKIIMLGDSGVGKTSLIYKYNDPDYEISQQDTNATIGYEYITIEREIEGTKATVYLWDTMGQDKFNSIAKTYFRNAAGVIFIYDITNRKSFDSLSEWVRQVDDSSDEAIPIVIGNKVDKEKYRQVTRMEGEKFAQENNAAFYEVSANTGYNIKNAIDLLLSVVFKNIYDKSISLKYTQNK